MNNSANVDLSPGRAKRFTPGALPQAHRIAAGALGMLMVILAMLLPTPARAADGCKVLL